MAIVDGGRRSVAARADLRQAMRDLRLAELREGVWLRPDNLDGGWADAPEAIVDAQCRRFVSDLVPPSRQVSSRPPARATGGRDGAVELAAALWDLAGWADRAAKLRAELAAVVGSLEAGDTSALAPGFVLSASVLRHLLADPLLPAELLADDWPGDALRHDYDRYDRAFKTVWRDWFRRVADPPRT